MLSSIPQENSIQERQCIISQAAARGLQLSEDGRIWVPINSESSNHPLNQSNVKNGSQKSNSEATGITIWYLFYASVAILGGIFVILIGLMFIFTALYPVIQPPPSYEWLNRE